MDNTVLFQKTQYFRICILYISLNMYIPHATGKKEKQPSAEKQSRKKAFPPSVFMDPERKTFLIQNVDFYPRFSPNGKKLKKIFPVKGGDYFLFFCPLYFKKRNLLTSAQIQKALCLPSLCRNAKTALKKLQ